ncbi:unnamed protein product [Cylicocyclus nassatus]|uniref:Uncharacterized protein n=1 Tax=Cylicocyclus nassatus TaxID=53992 RepID=A0AA36HD96_CYLNA|nr:unnamed protein product [Cylicocyclus nassatus]
MSWLAVRICLLWSMVKAQWNIPGANDGFGPIMGAGRQTGIRFGPYGETSASNLPQNLLAADLAPQFARFGSQYPGYGTQSIMEPTSIFANPADFQNVNPLLLPSQTRPVRQFTHQPPATFGLPSSPQNPYRQMGMDPSQFGGYSPFQQADDADRSVDKTAEIPPSQPIRVVPPFLKDASKEEQDRNIYAQYQRASSGDLKEKREKVHAAVAVMSPEAQQQFQKSFDLENVVLEPAPKPVFLMNATYDAIKQFMSIYREPQISQLHKVTELDVLIGTLRPEVQQAYQAYKAETLLLRLTQDERLQEIAEKAHFTMVHLAALKKSSIGVNEHKRRIELIFSEFSDFMVQAVTDEIANTVDLVMRQMLRALLFTEKMTQK